MDKNQVIKIAIHTSILDHKLAIVVYREKDNYCRYYRDPTHATLNRLSDITYKDEYKTGLIAANNVMSVFIRLEE